MIELNTPYQPSKSPLFSQYRGVCQHYCRESKKEGRGRLAGQAGNFTVAVGLQPLITFNHTSRFLGNQLLVPVRLLHSVDSPWSPDPHYAASLHNVQHAHWQRAPEHQAW